MFDDKPTVKIDQLFNYVKFYVKIRFKGQDNEFVQAKKQSDTSDIALSDEIITKDTNTVFIRADFVMCKREFFGDYGADDNEFEMLSKRLCIDTTGIEDYLGVKNTYSNIKDRVDFSI